MFSFLKNELGRGICKSKKHIHNIIEYPIPKNNISFNHDNKFIHEYKLAEYTQDIYYKTYNGYIRKYDFLNSSIFVEIVSIPFILLLLAFLIISDKSGIKSFMFKWQWLSIIIFLNPFYQILEK